jgi:SNF2 family DNA or RNA helicase
MNKLPQFKQRVKPYAHQKEVIDLSWDREYFALLMEMGTGKSKVAIDTTAALYLDKKINGCLILAPKGAYLNWNINEIPEHMPDEIDYYVGVWSSVMNKEQEAKIRNVIQPIENHLDILVMNIEAINSDRALMFAIQFLENHDAITIIDESDCIKSITASRTKKALTLGKLSKYRRILTGTPITHSPLDLFSQFEFLKPGALKFTSFTAFRAYYANIVLVRMGNRAFNQVKGFRNLEQMQRDLAGVAYRKLKTECLDLPEKVYSTRYISMSPEQAMIYEKFKEEALIELSGEFVTSTSALTTLMKLQQIACGHVTNDAGVSVEIPNSRLEALDEIVQQVNGKIIIWCNFQADVRNVVKHLNEAIPDSAVSYYGETTDIDRATALRRFKEDPTCLYFVGTPGTGGRGLTLVESHTTIYYSNGHKLGDRLQSEDRNHRIGQKVTVDIIDIVCEKTVDVKIVGCLRSKKDIADLVLNNWRDILC